MTETDEIEALKQRMTVMEREIAELKAVRTQKREGNPLASLNGVYANNPRVPLLREEMAEYRRQVDAEGE